MFPVGSSGRGAGGTGSSAGPTAGLWNVPETTRVLCNVLLGG